MNIENPHVDLGVACVYSLTGTNGKAYIGKTVRPLEERVRSHIIGKAVIGSALRKYGLENFKSEILLIGTEEYCYAMELCLIQAQGTLCPGGYNIRDGGYGMTREDARRLNGTPEARERQRQRGRSPENLKQLVRMAQLPKTKAALKRHANSAKNLDRLACLQRTPEARERHRQRGNSPENLSHLKRLHESEQHKEILIRGRQTHMRHARERDEVFLTVLRNANSEGITLPQLISFLNVTMQSVRWRIFRLRRQGLKIICKNKYHYHLVEKAEIK